MIPRWLWALGAFITGAAICIAAVWLIGSRTPSPPAQTPLEEEGEASPTARPAPNERAGALAASTLRRKDSTSPRIYKRVHVRILVQAPTGAVFEGPVEVEIAPTPVRTSPEGRELRPQIKSRQPRSDSQRLIAFDFEGITPASYRISARAQHLETIFLDTSIPANAPFSRFVLNLLPLVSLHGTLYAGERMESSIPYCLVTLRRVSPSVDGDLPSYQTMSDENGHYRLVGILRGAYDLLVGLPSRPLAPAVRIELARDGQQDIPDLPDVGEVVLNVLDPASLPLADVRIDVVPANDQGRGGGFGRTDANGVLRLGGLPPGPYKVIAQKKGFDNSTTSYTQGPPGAQPQLHGLVLQPREH